MNVEEYQIAAARTLNRELGFGSSGSRSWSGYLLEGLIGLNSEAGEALEVWKKFRYHGHTLNRRHIALELGDALWYLTEAAIGIGYSLEEIMNMNIEKLEKRYPDGFDPERSKHREKDDI